jgi:hypothetical protein
MSRAAPARPRGASTIPPDARPKLVVNPLTPERWPDPEALFNARAGEKSMLRRTMQ